MMCLTEPHAGTDLGIIKTKAVPNDDGSYDISGTKIFITGGEHDLTDNIIHLVLPKRQTRQKDQKVFLCLSCLNSWSMKMVA